MTNPVLVEVERGGQVDSCHHGAVAVVDAHGRSRLILGDGARPIFARSAVKALQALPLLETGAADRYGLGDEELALAASSHSGEPAHIAGVGRMLKQCGLDVTALGCGAHWPLNQASARALAPGASPRRCITIVRANTRDSSAWPAPPGSLMPATLAPRIPFSVR